MYHFAIIDDEPIFCNKINHLIDVTLFNTELQYQVTTFNTIKPFLLANHDLFYDLLFLDIEVGEQNGLSLAKTLREQEKKTVIIYVSSHDKYMKNSFGLNIYGYILKQEMSNELPILLKSAINHLTSVKSITLQTDNGIESFNLQNIMYFEYYERKVYLYTSKEKVCIHISSLSKIKERLNSDFIAPNANFVINMHFIQKISKSGQITLENSKVEFKISYGKVRKLTEVYKNFLVKEVDK